MAASYAISKLGEIQRRMVEERRDKENLKRRFAQNQDDCTYTILALLPTLGDQLFEYMDVEGLTNKLQKGRQSASGTQTPHKTDPGLDDKHTTKSEPAGQTQDGEHADENTIQSIKDERNQEPSSEAAYVKENGKPVEEHSHVFDDRNGQPSGPPNGENGTVRSAESGEATNSENGTAQSAMEEVWKKLEKDDTAQHTARQSNEATQINGMPLKEKEGASGSESAVDTEKRKGVAENESTADSEKEKERGSGNESAVNGQAKLKRETSGLDAVAEPVPLPIRADARLTPSPYASPQVEESEKSALDRSTKLEHRAEHNDTIEPQDTSQETYASPPPKTPEEILAEKRTKLELWNELKITAFARTITTLYGVVLLSLQTQVQLNLLGRHAYVTSVSSLSTGGPAPSNHQIRIERFDSEQDTLLEEDAQESEQSIKGIDAETERLYLTLSWWFLHRGWKRLAHLVESAVEEVFGPVALKAPLTYSELTSLLQKVRRRVEYEHSEEASTVLSTSMASLDARSEWSEATTAKNGRRRRRNFVDILFPPASHEMQVLMDAGSVDPASLPPVGATLDTLSPHLPGLLDETRDILESHDFWHVFKLGTQQVFHVFATSLRPTFGLPSELPAPVPSITELPEHDPQETKIRLASLFPIVARQSTAAIHGVPNEYIDALANIKELRAFCAVIYSAWS